MPEIAPDPPLRSAKYISAKSFFLKSRNDLGTMQGRLGHYFEAGSMRALYFRGPGKTLVEPE